MTPAWTPSTARPCRGRRLRQPGQAHQLSCEIGLYAQNRHPVLYWRYESSHLASCEANMIGVENPEDGFDLAAEVSRRAPQLRAEKERLRQTPSNEQQVTQANARFQVQHGQPGQFRGRGDDQVRD